VRVLRKHGIRLKLQGQPLDVLEALIERPGEIVSRQDLQKRLWGDDTYVDFERGLNTAVKRLRAALGDAPDSPRYIETVARTGYVFMAPVTEVLVSVAPAPPLSEPPPSRRRWFWAAGGAIAASAAATAFINRNRKGEVRLRKLSFGQGTISNAFFTHDGRSLVYSARWAGDKWKTFHQRLNQTQPVSIGLEGYGVAAVSDYNELVLFAYDPSVSAVGTIVRAGIEGGPPQHIDDNVLSADWALDRKNVAIVRSDGVEDRVEYPKGRTMHSTRGSLSTVRVSPTDGAVAVLEHPVKGDSAGHILMLERGKPVRRLTEDWPHMVAAGWHPTGQEVWFTGSRDGSTTALWAADRAGNIRMVGLAGMADGTFDVHRTGQVAFVKNAARVESTLAFAGEPAPRDLQHMGWTRVMAMAARGSVTLFDESAEAVKNVYRSFAYFRDSRQIRDLGTGVAQSLSPDGSLALLIDPEDRGRLILVQVSTNERTTLQSRGLVYDSARLLPAGQRLLVCARWRSQPNGIPFLAVHPVQGGDVAVLPGSEGYAGAHVSPNGKFVAAGRGRISRWDDWNLPPSPVELNETANLVGFDSQGRYVVRVAVRDSMGTAALFPVENGRVLSTPLWNLKPADPRGAGRFQSLLLATDGSAAAFSIRRTSSELFLAEGLA